MKTSNSNLYELEIRYIFIAIVFLNLFASCNKDKETTPNYVGNWELSNDPNRYVIILNQNSFQINSFFNVNDEYEYMFASESGDLTVTTDSLKFKMNIMKVDTVFVNDLTPSEELIEYIRGTAAFDEIYGETADFNCKYEIIGDTLKIWWPETYGEYNRIP